MMRVFDLQFAKEQLGFDNSHISTHRDDSCSILSHYEKGKNALKDILNHFGMSNSSDPMIEIWNQHLGLLANSSMYEMRQKKEACRMLYLLQNHYVKTYLKEKTLGNDTSGSIKRVKILQSALANVSQYNGKG